MSAAAALGPLVADYLEEVEIEGKSRLTARNYGRYLGVFMSWLSGITGREPDSLRLSDIHAERLRQYRLYLARRRDSRSGHVIGPATRNLYQIALRNFLRYCRRSRRLEAPDPSETLVLAKERDVPIRHVERADVVRLAAAIKIDGAAGLRDRAIVETLFGTGCRVSELLALTIRQLDLERRELEVIGKGGRSRLIFLTKDAAGWLRRYLETRTDDSPWVFVSNRKDENGVLRPLTARQVQRIVDAASGRAGLPFRVSPHTFRHGRLTVVARHLGVEAAQRIAGHASLNTTARYLHVTDAHLRAGYDEAERAEGGN